MAAAKDVAAFLTFLAHNGVEEDLLTHLRLQKLLYYVQGWSLALRGAPMFTDRVEAWAHGPVVPTIYQTLRDSGSKPFRIDAEPNDFNMSDEERAFVSEVWEEYKLFAALKLRDMTHSESPWIDARKGHSPGERCNVEITPEAMRTHFSKLAVA